MGKSTESKKIHWRDELSDFLEITKSSNAESQNAQCQFVLHISDSRKKHNYLFECKNKKQRDKIIDKILTQANQTRENGQPKLRSQVGSLTVTTLNAPCKVMLDIGSGKKLSSREVRRLEVQSDDEKKADGDEVMFHGQRHGQHQQPLLSAACKKCGKESKDFKPYPINKRPKDDVSGNKRPKKSRRGGGDKGCSCTAEDCVHCLECGCQVACFCFLICGGN